MHNEGIYNACIDTCIFVAAVCGTQVHRHPFSVGWPLYTKVTQVITKPHIYTFSQQLIKQPGH